MKATKITYYVTTGLISFAMAFSTFAYLTNPALKDAFQHLGFPDYFRIELGIAKGLAAIAIWLPIPYAKEVSYIELSISFISGFIAHIVVGDSILHIIYPLLIFAILVVSYVMYGKLTNVVVGKAE